MIKIRGHFLCHVNMINLYKIQDVTFVEQDLSDIEANGGATYCITILSDAKNNLLQSSLFDDDGYEAMWPIAFQGMEEWGYRIYEDVPQLFHEYNHTKESNVVARQLYTVIPVPYVPKKGTYCAFVNQFDKRITNEEVEELFAELQVTDTEDIISFEIGEDNKLHKI